MNIYVDIDNTICLTDDSKGIDKYITAIPNQSKILYINNLYDKGNKITYWTARGNKSGIDHSELTVKQLSEWGCKYHELIMGSKPSFDLLIDDKTMNPKEIPDAPTNSNKQTPMVVPKGWGHEIIFVNNEKYCGKILHFKQGAKFSMHYHLIKMETWYVHSGKFVFKYIDTRTADIHEMTLSTGDTITNSIGEPHQLICIEEGDVFEVSTTHDDRDSYRVFKGDSQCPCGTT
jgi:quercetin dioxygenase-like cupin family protein